ncbi:amino acid/polyamine/organocation transporter, APC superfamily [Bryocella elongata]|uniref:Amino acid/polyamine/organocation transporter, APC superfamily n=1 Tax=Bryocella elongata TaxID=863522 RepID=A0A1H6AG43_9BACT|nr:APC family permease [Bryocella elongata]SEG46985.1 amino acid/polyamine/organocation transporter, APC superfamily [Bryocella elongata]
MHHETATISDGPKTSFSPSFGLREGALSPLETLAQSISTIAPSTSPPATIPLVFALAGQGTAIAYLVATALMILVGLCVAAFARESSSPGSLYVYTRRSLPEACGAITAWALFCAYIATASAVIGGFLKFSFVFLDRIPATAHLPRTLTSVALVAIAAATATWVAYRDVKISARMMLYIEAISVVLISIVIGATLFRHGWNLDHRQFAVASLLKWPASRGVGLGVMLAIFSFVGFESATTLGAEAQNPLRTIPRAVIQSAILSGIFFIVCCYGEVMGFAGSPIALDQSDAPFHYLAGAAHIGFAASVIDAGVLVSAFAATLSCVIASSRVLLLMAHDGMAHSSLKHTSAVHETPGLASLLAGALAFLPAALMALRGATGSDIYNWAGTFAVYGFLTAYGMVAVALAFHLKNTGRLTAVTLLLTGAATLAMLAAMASNFYPVPPAPLVYFPYFYAAYLVVAVGWVMMHRRRSRVA